MLAREVILDADQPHAILQPGPGNPVVFRVSLGDLGGSRAEGLKSPGGLEA
jgi:hypothetical protein